MFNHILIFILSLAVLLLVPILFILLSPIVLYRQAVIILSKLCKPNFHSILDPFSSLFANLDLYKEDTVLGGTAVLVLKGRVELENVRDSFHERILSLKNPISGELVYYKLTHKVSHWLGYYFWEPEQNFDLKSHFQIHNADNGTQAGISDVVIRENELQRIIEALLKQPFTSDKSPWQINIVHNISLQNGNDEQEIENNTAVIIYANHSLTDGASLGRMLQVWGSDSDPASSASNQKVQINAVNGKLKPNIPMKTVLLNYMTKLVMILKLVFCGPYELISQTIDTQDENIWTKIPKADWTGLYNTYTSEPIPLQLIKTIKKLHGTSFMAVILAAYAGGINTFMLNNGIPVPTSIHCMIPVLLPSENKGVSKLGNFFSNVILKLPLASPNSQSRLRTINGRLHKLRFSSMITLNNFIPNLIGRIPTGLLPSFAPSIGHTTLLSNVPGPTETLVLCNKEGISLTAYGNIVPGLSCFRADLHINPDLKPYALRMYRVFKHPGRGLAAVVISYTDHLRFILGADQSIIPLAQPMKDLHACILEELSELLKLEIV